MIPGASESSSEKPPEIRSTLAEHHGVESSQRELDNDRPSEEQDGYSRLGWSCWWWRPRCVDQLGVKGRREGVGPRRSTLWEP